MKKEYRVVLVGCGHMGAAHLNEIYYRENIVISGVVDLDPLKAQHFMKRYGALSWNTDYTAYLQDPNNVNGDRKPTWEQLQHLIRMIEEDIEALPNIDEVYKAFEIAVEADHTIRLNHYKASTG